MPIKCCKGCVPPKRHTACWGHCPEYLEEKAEYDRLKAIYDEKKKVGIGIYLSRADKVNKAMKNRRHKKI